MWTRTTRAGRAAPGVTVGALAALALSAFLLAGCGSEKEAPKGGATTGGAGGKTDPAKGTADPGKTDPGKTDPGKAAGGGASTAGAPASGPMAYVPKGAYAFMHVRPSRLLGSELVKAMPPEMLADFFEKFDKDKPFDVDLKKVEAITVAVLPPPKDNPAGDRETTVLVQYADPLAVATIGDGMKKDGFEIAEKEHKGKKYLQGKRSVPQFRPPPAIEKPASKEEGLKVPPDEDEEEEKKEEPDPAGPPGFPPPRPRPNIALVQIDPKSILAGHETAVLAALDGVEPGTLAARLKGVSLDKDLVFAILPAEDKFGTMMAAGPAANELPEEAQEKLADQIEKTKAVVVGLDFTGDTLLSVTLESDASETAKGLETQANAGIPALKGMYEAVTGPMRLDEAPADQKKMVEFGDKLIAGLSVAQSGNDVTVAIKNPKGWDALKPALQMAWQQAEEAKKRTMRSNNLKIVGLGIHNYHDQYQSLPPAKDAKGKGLSWRVHILPQLGETELYEQFNLDEPWDSDTNKKLIEKIPEVYKSDAVKEPGKTRILGFSGEGALFGGEKSLALGEVLDGTSATILAAEVAPDKAVIWTKPEDAKFDKDDPKAALGNSSEDKIMFLMLDGSVRTLSKSIDAELLKALITPAAGDDVDFTKLK